MQNPKLQTYKIFHYTSLNPSKKVNSAFLMGSYMLLVLSKTSTEIIDLFSQVTTFASYCDASQEKSDFELPFFECLKGLEKAIKLNWYNLSTFDLRSYETGSIIENGGYNWIIPSKIVAFMCPAHDFKGRDGIKPPTPEQYVPIFQNLPISTIVRLNKATYESDRFTRHGFKFHDMYFIDGSVPSDKIVREFIKVVEEDGAIAVHCKAGLGRTATLIGCYVMKHYGFTALEFMGWARICRPGSVLGPQQQFLIDIQEVCWKWGEDFRNGITEMEECKELPQHEHLSEADKFKAKYGDYKQAEKLCAAEGENRRDSVKVHSPTNHKGKVVKKAAFSKNK